MTGKGTIGERAARSTAYLLVRRIIGYVVRFAAIAVLARRLDVAEFGIVAMATTCINIMVGFGAAGVNTWVIYDREDGWEQRARSAWWLNMLIAAGQTGLATALIPVVVWFYGEPSLTPILGVLIATFFIEQLREVPDSLLERRLAFRTVAARDMANDFATGVLGVIMALAGGGLWSLVVPRFVLSPIFLLVTLRAARWTPGWQMHREHWRRILAYTIHLIGSNLLHVVSNDGDTVMVGRIFGKADVGLYDTAYTLANLIGRNVTAVISQVSMPVLAEVRERTGSLANECIRMYRMIATVTTPALGGLFVIAGDLVLLLYGPKWVGVTPLMRIFIVFTMVRAITSPSGAILNVVGKPNVGFKLYLVLAVLIFTGVGIGSMYGVVYVTIGVSVARILSGTLSFGVSLAAVDASVLRGFRALAPSTVAALGMTAGTFVVRYQLESIGVPLGVRLAVVIALGVVLYPLFLRAISRKAFGEAVELARRFSPRLRKLAPGKLAGPGSP